MAHTWNKDRASDHIKSKIGDVKNVTIVDYSRDLSLENIPKNKAYRVNGVHIYADILNLKDMLGCTAIEGETCHKRTIRFLNLHYRAVHRALRDCDVKRVDFHNQRLHALVTKPYGDASEADRVHRAVALAQLLIDVVAQTGDEDEHIENAKLRVGIDSGLALAVNNGRNGGREPLFLGNPANHAAKAAAAGSSKGVFLTDAARAAIGLPAVAFANTTALTKDQIATSQDAAKLDATVESIVSEWKKDIEANPIGAIEFSRPTPPLKNLDITALTPGNSRRFEAVSLYADIDNFTKYVASHIDNDAEDVVRVLHVLRAELDRVFYTEFGGRRIRFIGDCLHGLMFEGTSQTTYDKETISDAVLCAGALRSSFDLALKLLTEDGLDVEDLGLQIGFEYGPMTVTRLGMQGDRVRCAVSRGVLASEAEQGRCGAKETAIGQNAYDTSTQAVKDLFGSNRKKKNLDYNEAVEALAEGKDEAAKASLVKSFAAASPAVVRSLETSVKPYAFG